MRVLIPAHVISVVGDLIADWETHASLDSLLMCAGAPGDPPEGNKRVKAQEWFRRANRDEAVDPMEVLGRAIEGYMEADLEDAFNGDRFRERRDAIEKALGRADLKYVRGGRVTGSVATPSRSLEELMRGRDLSAIDDEFARALRNVEQNPREAVSAACNILESLCKTYIEVEGLEMPRKKDLRPVWEVVRKHLGFDPSRVEDRDLQEILSGLLGVASGISALRSHASSAHGATAKSYRLEPRHARLAVHAAHTLVAFVLESWDKKRAG